jgi:hypothetical protein
VTALAIGLLIVATILSIAGGIMFTVAAFRVSVVWGLLVLFVPFAPLVFLVKYWAEAKKPFMFSLAGAGVGVVGFFFLFSGAVAAGRAAVTEAATHARAETMKAEGIDRGVPERAKVVAVTPPPSEPAPVAEPTADDAGEAVPQTAEAGSVDETEAFERLKESPDAAPISEEIRQVDLAHHIGQRLLLVDRTGREMRGTLLSVGPRALRIERELSGGSVSYNVARADLKEIRSLN